MKRLDPLDAVAGEAPPSQEQLERDYRAQLEERYSPFGDIVFPKDAVAPILTPSVRAVLQQLLTEINMAEALRSVGLTPRQRTLLAGPPGCGKTTLAHHVSARLGLPLVVVQTGNIITAKFGGTGNNLADLFKEARRDKGKVAIFFDEFDSLAVKRREADSSAGSERNNIAITILQELDRFNGVLFAATNRREDIDPAIWRRFQMQIEIGMPGNAERFAIVRLYTLPFALADATVQALADAFNGASPALIKEGCEAIKRALVLGPKMNLPTDLPAILARFTTSAAPAEGAAIPPLWDDFAECAEICAGVPWPPELA
jgi:hypothetical protein